MPRRASPSPLHLDAYIRVSSTRGRKGERFLSPSIQRDRIAAWADPRGVVLQEVFEELDHSGARADRPLLAEAIVRIEQGVSEGLVVADVTRFHRSFLDGLLTIERVRVAGGHFYSVDDGLDTATDSGREVLRQRLSSAEWQLDRIRASWEEARVRAVKRGVYTGSIVPIGYRKTRAGRLRPHPVAGPLVTEAFRRRAAGEDLPPLCRWLEAEGLKTAMGNPGWVATSLRRVLGNRVYLGELTCGPHHRDKAHRALTDPVTWELAQHPSRAIYPRHPSPAMFAGLVRCASCGMRMCAQPRMLSGRVERYYCCRVNYGAGRCPSPAYMSASLLDPCVEDAMFDLLRRRRRPPRGALSDAEDALRGAERGLARYRDSSQLLELLGETRFVEGVRVRIDRLRDARLAVAEARLRAGTHDLPTAAGLERSWPQQSFAERRRLAESVIDCVFVSPGFRHIAERLVICPAGTAPRDLVQKGDKRTRIQAYDIRRGWVRPGDLKSARWTRVRLERELRAFVASRTVWPSRERFLDAGRASLHRQVVLQGGEAAWSQYLGLPIRSREVARERWNDERIRDGLALYLHGKSEWPSVKDFKRDGVGALRGAMGRHGGLNRWTQEFPLPCSEWRRGGRKRYWTEDRIRARLQPLCTERERFPTQREFKLAGEEGLLKALYRFGGTERWACEMGVRPPSSDRLPPWLARP